MTSFYDRIRLRAWGFRLVRPIGVTRLRNGQSIPYQIGAEYWAGSAQLSSQYHHKQAATEMDLIALSRPGATFLVWDDRFNGPMLDPGGVILGDATPSIHTLNADNRRIRVQGLPPNYVLSRGDYLGYQYGSGPVRYGMHRIDEDVAATSAGLTPLFAIEPNIRLGVEIGAPVQLIQPVCRARIISSSYGNARPLITEGASFEWEETLR